MRQPRLYSTFLAIAALSVLGTGSALNNETSTKLGIGSPPSVASPQESTGFKGRLLKHRSVSSHAAAARAKAQSPRASLARSPLTGGTKIVSSDFWTWQNPIPQGNDLYAVWGNGPHDVFAVGAGGTVLHYDGTAWTGMTSGTTSDLYAAWGNGVDTFAVGAGGTVLYYDRTSWRVLSSGTTNELRGVWGSQICGAGGSCFSVVYVVGASGTIRYVGYPVGSDATVVSQALWKSAVSGVSTDLYAVGGADWQHVIAVGDGGTILQGNGTIWTSMTSGTASALKSVWGSSNTDVYAAGDTDILHYDGTSWGALYLQDSYGLQPPYGALWGTSATEVFAVAGSAIVHSDGFDWSSVLDDPAYHINGLWGCSPTWGAAANKVFAVGTGGRILHFDGSVWTSNTVTTSGINGVWARSATDVYAVADGNTDGGLVLHYDGSVWSGASPFEAFTPYAIWGDASTPYVFVVGSLGEIDWYNGSAWGGNRFPASHLYGIWGRTSSDVYAVGLGGAILHFDGTTFTDIVSGIADFPTADFYGVWVDPATGDVFVVGAEGYALHYHDGAWTYGHYSGGDLYAVWGRSASDVFAVGVGGTILHYNGSAWSTLDGAYEGGADLLGIWGSATTEDIFVLGAGGTILHYDGNAWHEMSSGTSNDLYSVWGNSPTDVFAVGAAGTILHYEPPTAPPNPVPTTTSISPTTKTVGDAEFTLTVNGSNFISSSVVRYNGSNRSTTHVNDAQLTATLLASDLRSAGSFDITVFNPSPGGGTSGHQTLTVSLALTSLAVGSATGTCNDSATLSATLTSAGSPLVGRQISFSLNGAFEGNATTVPGGVATLQVALSNIVAGQYDGGITAEFAPDGTYAGSNGRNTLIVGKTTTYLYVKASSGPYGGTTTLEAWLYTGSYHGLSGKLVTFEPFGGLGTNHPSATTDSNGWIQVPDVFLGYAGGGKMDPGTYTGALQASFEGNDCYAARSGAANLQVNKGQTTTVGADVTISNTTGHWVHLTATVASPGNTIYEGIVKFSV